VIRKQNAGNAKCVQNLEDISDKEEQQQQQQQQQPQQPQQQRTEEFLASSTARPQQLPKLLGRLRPTPLTESTAFADKKLAKSTPDQRPTKVLTLSECL
jgi:hypothetical protein